jgi:predicted TIM-barrel fold metal-dependent hydrolase
MGDDNIVFSTDYPHGDSEFPTSVNEFLKQPLSRETKSKILWNNCARLYNIS